MPTITGDSAIDVAVGLAFLFFLLSIVCSSVNEAVAAAFKLRAATLEASIRSLINDPKKAADFYGNGRMQTLFTKTIFRNEKKPSYIPPRVFALTLLDTFAPATPGQASDDLIGRAQAAVARMQAVKAGAGGTPADVTAGAAPQENVTASAAPQANVTAGATPEENVEDKVLVMLQDALDQAGSDRDKFQTALETAFNQLMDRVSGWYKRRSQLFLFVIALAIAGGLNADSFTIGQRLWKDDVLRAAVVAQATSTAAAGKASCTTGGQANTSATQSGTPTSPNTSNAAPLETTAECVDEVKQLGLPIGWTKATSPNTSAQDVAKAFGLLLTAFAIMLGAPFWFDFLGQVAQLRSAGAKPSSPDAT
jgi:hypothetical protein